MRTTNVPWTAMEEGSGEDFAFLSATYAAHTEGRLADSLMATLRQLADPTLGTTAPWPPRCWPRSSTRRPRG